MPVRGNIFEPMEDTIYKVQRPIFTSEGEGNIYLVYTEGGEPAQFKPNREMRKLMGSKYKIYVRFVDNKFELADEQEPGW